MYCHRVEIYTGKKKSWEKDTFEVCEENVLAENAGYIVLNDTQFTKIEKRKDKDFNCYSVIDYPTIEINVDDRFWSDGVVFNLYSYSKWPATQIERDIKAAIAKKCGWMKGRISFAILKTGGELKGASREQA